MARFYYECNADLRNGTEESETIKPYACTQDKYCLYCCCNSQCCLLIQRRPPRHVWEAWYFWLGVALLAVFIISSVSSYIVSNCRHNIQGVPLRHSAHGNQRNDRGGTRPGNNQNEISISIIPTSEFFPSHRKMFVIASQPAVNHLSRRCVCTSKACKEAGVDTCRTKFYCYTELILTGDQEFGANTTTRGCTKGATPLLCETKSWVTRSKSSDNVDRSSAAWIRMPWPRLKCCDSHDYCNADRHANASTWTGDNPERPDPDGHALNYTGSFNGMSPSRDVMGSIQPDPGPIAGGRESPDQFPENRVKPLHVAALVLAIAALISVLAACYVVTRFLKTNPYTVGSVE